MNEVVRIQNTKRAAIYQGGRLDVLMLTRNPAMADFLVLCAAEFQPDLDVNGVRVPMHDLELPDAWVTEAYVNAASRAAKEVVKALGHGKCVLVTCAAGLNRSGLVTGLSLRMLGYGPDEAVAMVRRARGPQALSNRSFAKIVRTYEGAPASTPSR